MTRFGKLASGIGGYSTLAEISAKRAQAHVCHACYRNRHQECKPIRMKHGNRIPCKCAVCAKGKQ